MKLMKYVIGVIVVVLVIWGITSLGGDNSPTETGPIKIGFIGPLTGDAASFGEQAVNAITLAVEKINNSGGVNGRMVEMIYEDGQCSGVPSANAAKKLVDADKVKFILGGQCSGETLAAIPITEQGKVLLFSSWSTSPDISELGDFVFRNAPSDTITGKAVSDLIIRNGISDVSMIVANTEFATGFADVFEKNFKDGGGAVLIREQYAPGTTDFRSVITKALEKKPSALLISPQDETGGILVRQMLEQGYDGPIYSNNTINGEASFNAGNGSTEGVYYSDTSGLSEDNRGAQEFLENYVERFGGRPAFPYFAGASYDALNMIVEAISEVGEDAEAVADYFYEFEGYEGLIGLNKFDKNGDILEVSFSDYQIDSTGNGVIVQ